MFRYLFLFVFLSFLILSNNPYITCQTSTPGSGQYANQLTNSQRQAFLDAHNIARATVSSPPASDLRYLYWDYGLESKANSDAANCAGNRPYDGTSNIYSQLRSGGSGGLQVPLGNAMTAWGLLSQWYQFSPSTNNPYFLCPNGLNIYTIYYDIIIIIIILYIDISMASVKFV